MIVEQCEVVTKL